MLDRYTITQADILDYLTRLKAANEALTQAGKRPNLYHAVLTDPPYSYDTIEKRFGTGAAANQPLYERSSGGFMGMKWDSAITHTPQFWSLLSDCLYPGAFVIAFNGARQWHRQAVAMEAAGFILHPSIFGWVYGSGLAKPVKVDQRIDKRNKDERPKTGRTRKANDYRNDSYNRPNSPENDSDYKYFQYEQTAPASEQSAQWEGWAYGRQALKPALEPITIAQKPHDHKTQLDGILEHGAGALNIGATRVNGREPANYWVSHHPDCKSHYCVPECGLWQTNQQEYFLTVGNRLLEAEPAYYCAKPQPDERHGGLDGKNPHPTVKPLELTEWLAQLLLPPPHIADDAKLLIPFAGVGSEIIGALKAGWQHIDGVELDQKNDGTTAGYIAVAHKRIKHHLETQRADVDPRQTSFLEQGVE